MEESGISQKQLELRRKIEKGRHELRYLQVNKLRLQSEETKILESLTNCESKERRRVDVAFETEKALAEIKY